MEKINTSILDNFLKQALIEEYSRNIVLKWNFKNKLAACGIIASLAPQGSETKKISDACIVVSKLIGTDLVEIDRKVSKLITTKHKGH